ncbi:MAG: DUF547 domain-containing protein [Candidatus Mycalebacterium zealandia]|nr:MAG: DUF547 domain-containing protein [Candidatus Mycalebacterium zealandia]
MKDVRANLKLLAVLFFLCLFFFPFTADARSGIKDLRRTHNPRSSGTVSHKAWNDFLRVYVHVRRGANLVNYRGVTNADARALDDYISTLRRVKVSGLNRAEQKAFWINLYNALTVQTILNAYPVSSILDIDTSPPGTDGPWGKKIVSVEGVLLSLDDIEHGILRPVWKDARIHYAVNCASIGCPDLAPVAYTAENTEQLLENGARDFANHPRGVKVKDGKLVISSIYFWFAEDFGGVREHIAKYAAPKLAATVKRTSGLVEGGYDWSLNEK